MFLKNCKYTHMGYATQQRQYAACNLQYLPSGLSQVNIYPALTCWFYLEQHTELAHEFKIGYFGRCTTFYSLCYQEICMKHRMIVFSFQQCIDIHLGFPGGPVVKILPASAGARGDMALSLDWEDPLEWEVATCSSILAWKIPWTEEPGGLQFIWSQRVQPD